MADSVESMIGAHFLTNDDLGMTLKWISDIKLVPLEQSRLLECFANIKESTYAHLRHVELKQLNFSTEDDLK